MADSSVPAVWPSHATDAQQDVRGRARVRALACLVGRGLRDIACTSRYDRAALPALSLEFGVEFAVRNPSAPPEKFDLSDDLVIYRAPRDPRLVALWADHRATLSRGVEIGQALGYFQPRATPAGSGRWLWHLAAVAGNGEAVLWTEYIEIDEDAERDGNLLDVYISKIRSVLAEAGVTHVTRFESWGANL